MSRKLDAVIAEALGYKVECWDEPPEKSIYSGLDKDYWTHDGDRRWHKVPAYSTDGNAMLKLIVEMQVRRWCFGVIMLDGDGESKSISKAVALAAYHALTGKEYEEENRGEKVSE